MPRRFLSPIAPLSVVLVPLVLVSLALLPQAAAADDELTQVKERELEAVRERISALKESMDKAGRDRDRVTAELEQAELRIAEQRMLLKDLERERRYTERQLAELGERIGQGEAELERESAELAEQVRAAYMSGGQERLKLLLNQENPALLGRMLAYYGYLNRHRAGNIEAVNTQLAELAELESRVVAEQARLAELARRRYDELGVLNAAQEKRRDLLDTLKERIASEAEEVERLAVEEKDLERLVAELTSILSDYPISSESPFSEHKGRLTWPVAGRLVSDYGQPRSGNLKWRGVVLAAARGSEVRSVYHGRVVFADWLAGMGLLIIVDHGDDYLTLYGYNETLLKNPGDWVAPGDVIATVGESGGQAEPSLYFELRKGTRPQSPRTWVSRQPGER